MTGGSRLPLLGLVAGNAVSLSGNVMASLAIPWCVLSTTGSAAQTGLVAFAATVPYAAGSLIAGRVVDLLGPKGTSVLSDVLSALTVGAIPVLHVSGALELWHLIALVFAGALLDAAGAAARVSMLPDAARAGGLTLERANSLFTGTEHVGYLVGAPLAGVSIAFLGAPNVLWIDAASFLWR